MDELTERLARLYTGAIHDVLRTLGHERVVLPAGIRPLDPARKVAGPVWTVAGRIDRTQSPHATLLGWTQLLSKAPPGRVVVCQPHNHEVALMGELSAETLKAKGVLGYVVDGGCRDVEFIVRIGFPVFASFYTPSDIVGRWIPERYGEPVAIGEVTICDGDYLLGDLDGVVAIPQAVAEEAIARTEAVAQTENRIRAAILGGMDPVDAYLKYGKF
jgi:regulator of RNase E activity RraA